MNALILHKFTDPLILVDNVKAPNGMSLLLVFNHINVISRASNTITFLYVIGYEILQTGWMDNVIVVAIGGRMTSTAATTAN
jgi:hypothetical protein